MTAPAPSTPATGPVTDQNRDPALDQTTQGTGWRRWLVAAVPIAVSVAAAVALRTPESAPIVDLVSANPSDLATVDRAPSHVQLSFTDVIDPQQTHVTVVAPNGSAVSDEGTLRTAGRTVRQQVAITRPGRYTVVFHVSARGGGVLTGTLRFTVLAADGTPTTPGPDTSRDSGPTGPADTADPDIGAAHAHNSDRVSPTMVTFLMANAVLLALVIGRAIRRRAVRRRNAARSVASD
ncbi:copper resistance CopC family protein [Micromonospora sonneratiae]|uniref:Copper resistance CopC family protein n=1 Tax=Micromonospora sonneratiae TaxID=1184706 RepID=A0ABW3YKU0_9ACTN